MFCISRSRIHAEMQALAAPVSGAAARTLEWPADLPPPVERYLRTAIARPTAIGTARLSHGGRFAPRDGRWMPIRGEQFFRTDPPAFVWWGRVRAAPGIWIDARDRSVDGAGTMLVKVESCVTLADSRGPETDQSALARMLGEMVWFPTAFLDTRHLRWAAIDETHARATLRVSGREATGVFEFGADSLPTLFRSDRFRDAGGGRSVLTPFTGRLLDYRAVQGVVAPHRVVGAWVIDGRTVEYADFIVDRADYD